MHLYIRRNPKFQSMPTQQDDCFICNVGTGQVLFYFAQSAECERNLEFAQLRSGQLCLHFLSPFNTWNPV